MELDTATIRILALLEREHEEDGGVMGAGPMTSDEFGCADSSADHALTRI